MFFTLWNTQWSFIDLAFVDYGVSYINKLRMVAVFEIIRLSCKATPIEIAFHFSYNYVTIFTPYFHRLAICMEMVKYFFRRITFIYFRN